MKLQTKMLRATLAFALFTGQYVMASEARVVIGTVDTSRADLKAFATSKDAIPYSESLEASRPGKEFEADLRVRFTRAQKAWLAGHTENARMEFRALTELSLKADWRPPQREVLLTGFMRLAQSSLSGIEKENWIEGAVKLFSDLEPHPSLFPPPIIEEFRATRIRMLENSLAIELWAVFPEARFVLIDGRKIDTAQRNAIFLPPGSHRVTALSDTHATFTEFLTPNQLRLFRAKPIALTEGSCSNARALPNQNLPQGTLLFVGRQCDAGVEQIDLRPQLLSASMMSDLRQPAKIESKSKTWLWVVGGVVLAGAGYALAHELNREKEPDQVHRSGF